MRPSPATTARQLAEAIERAADLGLTAHADRLAHTAVRLMTQSPRLTECIARLRLVQGNAETALSIIEGSRFRTESLRLIRAACLIEMGRSIEAEMDLNEWVRHTSAPAEARRLLAMIAPGSSARLLLRRSAVEEQDARSIELLVIDAIEHGSDDQARAWGAHLLAASRWQPSSVDAELFLGSLGVQADTHGAEEPAEREVAMLAMEIGAHEDFIPVLVQAQQAEPDRFTCALLRAAIERALPELTDQASGCEWFSRLSLLLNETDEAKRWMQRGMTINPMSASLALLAGEIDAKAGRNDAAECRAAQQRRAA